MRRRILLNSGGIDIDPITGRGMIGKYEVVDLGLSNGLLFATCNVGATVEYGYGNYYMYGKGSRKYTYGDSTYTGTEDPLDSSVDTATQVMGEGWRMPTVYELQALLSETNYEFVEDFNGSGINGSKFTSKTNPNAYVFFPAAGSCNGDDNGSLIGINDYGFYWSSTPSDFGPTSVAMMLSLGPDAISTYTAHHVRYDGFSVRGVYREPGKPMPPMSVLFVNKNDTTQKQIFEQDNWPSASYWTPIGIVVVPSSHNRYGDGTNGIMSLGCLNTSGTMQTSGTTDNVTMRWGYATDSPLSNYTSCDGSNGNGFVQLQNSIDTTLLYNGTPNIAYPYTSTDATEYNVITTGSLSDYDGVGNTNILNASASTFTAAAACNKFYTLGTSASDWYLPAEGELAYLPSIMYQVNDTISALNAKYGNVGVKLFKEGGYLSSTEADINKVWLVEIYRGNVRATFKTSIGFYVRAFMRF